MYVYRVRIFAWFSSHHICNVLTWDSLKYWLLVEICQEITKSRLASDKWCTIYTQSVLLNSIISFRLKNRFRRTNPRTDQKALQWLVSRECPWWWWWWTGACSASCSAWWSCASLGPLGHPSGWYFWCFDCCFFVFVVGYLLCGIGLFDFCCLLLLCLMVTCASLGLFGRWSGRYFIWFIYLAVLFVVFCPLFDK